MRRRRPALTLSLFPFLSVLMCAIGVMAVVFTATSMASLESTSQTFVVTVRDVPPLKPGEKVQREPTYVVCDASGLTVYQSPTEVYRFPAADFSKPDIEARIDAFVSSSIVPHETGRWPVLFVKPSGLKYMLPFYARLRKPDLKTGHVRVGKFAFAEDAVLECQAAAPGGVRP